MANKYVALVSGLFQEIAGLVTSAGAADAGKIPALDSSGKLDLTLMPSGIGPETVSVTTSENLSAGDIVNIYNNGGTPTARKADAANGFPANGFVLSGSTSGNAASVYLSGLNTQRSGLTGGLLYFLSATPGGITTSAPSTSGQISQQVGYAVSATALAFEAQPTVTLA